MNHQNEKELIQVDKIVQLQQMQTKRWHDEDLVISQEGFYKLVESNHLYNFQLWHGEDKTRREDLGFEFVFHAKRKIDQFNQKRNNMIETIDQWIFKHYQPKQEGCPSNSETPGMIIGRLSILSLKEFHMEKEAIRKESLEKQRILCQEKLVIIRKQYQCLQSCLKEFLDEILAKTRTFHIYYQFKMYNDPDLNPQLYRYRHSSNVLS